MIVKPGATVKVLFNAGAAGTCLTGPTQVVEAVQESGRTKTIGVAAPHGAVTADPDGILRIPAHPDYVLIVKPTTAANREDA